MDYPQYPPRSPANINPNRTQAWHVEFIKLGCPVALAAKAAVILNYQDGPLNQEEEAVIAEAWAHCDLSQLPEQN